MKEVLDDDLIIDNIFIDLMKLDLDVLVLILISKLFYIICVFSVVCV